MAKTASIANSQSSLRKPMLATLADAPLSNPALVYEPKYDGIRAIAELGPGAPVRLWSRLGNEKTNQFPEIAAALGKWTERLTAPVVLDGEIVALDENGEPAGFQRLQGRIHLAEGPSRSRERSAPVDSAPPSVAYVLFDLLHKGGRDLRSRPLTERRAALEKLVHATSRRDKSPIVRLSELVRSDGRHLYEEALSRGWEGLVVKRADSPYESGRRSPDWRKLKIVHEQEFVIGGWTEPRGARSYLGALLVGVYAPPASGSRKTRGATALLTYVGHIGTGFDERELSRLMRLLKPLETSLCPFAEVPSSNERPHWVRPDLVAQVRFTEWTDDGRLRQPVYLGLRDDKKPEDIVREPESRRARSSKPQTHKEARTPLRRSSGSRNGQAAKLVEQLTTIERERKDGLLDLGDGITFRVGNLDKVFWPASRLTKGDLLRYYSQVAPYILPVVEDRPLVMKRFPNGIDAAPFYQHHLDLTARVPKGVRVELMGGPGSSRRDERKPQFIGGTLATLLYMTQLAAISQDPWFSRAQSTDDVDFVALDLDPPEGLPFSRVLDVARWVRDELQALDVPAFPKTSGADGLHIYIPMPPHTPYEAGQLFCQIIATVVAEKHPKLATVERKVAKRGTRIYVDYLQNSFGKTIAAAYSARASAYAGVSTPVTWAEIDDGFAREEFTIVTVPARLNQVGDLWAKLRTSKGADLTRVTRYTKKR